MGYDSHHVASIGATTFAYHDTGSGEPLILHHGGESHKGQYSIFAPLLADGIRAISYDQRDVGDAPTAAGPYGMSELADDCAVLMDALGIEKAHIMGISFGGAIAMHVGLRHPDRVQSLVIGAAPDSFGRPNPFLDRMISLGAEDRSALMLDASLSPEAQQDELLMTTMHGLLRGRVTTPGSRRSEAIRSHGVSGDELASITAPALLVYGELDPLITTDVGRLVHQHLPNSELVVIPGARHGLSFEFREQLAALVSSWVADHRIDP